MSIALNLVSLLEKRNEELAKKYDVLRQRLETTIQNRTAFIDELPNFGPQHCSAVIENITCLLSANPPSSPFENTKVPFSDMEIFLLLCAIQFHPIGLLAAVEGEPSEAAFLNYPLRTRDALIKHLDEWKSILDPHQARIIGDICGGLSTSFYRDLPEDTYQLHTSPIRVKFLAALLRLGNILDYDHSMVSRHLLNLRVYSEASIAQYNTKHDIVGLDINSETWKIVIHSAPPMVEGRNLVNLYVTDTLQPELNLVAPELTRHHLHYGKIYHEPAPWVKERNERVTSGLASYYKLNEPNLNLNAHKFLHYYDPVDHRVFRGRRADIERFHGYIAAAFPLLVMHGESGVGKTSLVRAGLIPKLINDSFVAVYTRSFNDPVTAIKEAISRIMASIKDAPTVETQLDLPAFLVELARYGYQFVIFLDQFEEFFIHCPESLQEELIVELIKCTTTRPRLPVTFVILLRSEFLKRLDPFKRTLAELATNAFELRKLTEDQIREAIVEPAEELGMKYEPELIHQLVKDIYQGGQYNTPHLSIVCDRLEKALPSDADPKVITLKLYEDCGTARQILAEYLDLAISNFPLEEQSDVKSILKAMVTSHGTKSVLPPGEIALQSGLKEIVTGEYLSRLTDQSRLLRRLEGQEGASFELAHEFLVEGIDRWLNAEDKEAKDIDEMLGRQLIDHQLHGHYLNEQRLERIHQHRNRLILNDQKKAFVLESYLNVVPGSEDLQFWIETMEPVAATEVIIDSMGSARAATYEQCIKSLAQIGEPAIATLVATLDIDNWLVRQGAIEALVHIGTGTIAVMVEALAHDSRRIRRGACTVLARLGEVSRSPLEAKRESASKRTSEVIGECLSLIDYYQQSR